MMGAGWLPRDRLQALLDVLARSGYRCLGPRVRDGVIGFDELSRTADLPQGWTDRQSPGRYRLTREGGARLFDAVGGPQGLKPLSFAPREVLWRTVDDARGVRFEACEPPAEQVAVIGVRACDLAGLALQDKHFLRGIADARYAARRRALLLVAVECARSAETCFCASTGDGPAVHGGADLVLNELDEGFLVRACSDAGRTIADQLPLREATATHRTAAREAVEAAAAQQHRTLPGRNLRDTLFDRLDHPRWAAVAERCLSCGNCVAVCPTCFCSASREASALGGDVTERVRQWDSCFSAEHSYLHGRLLRPDTRTRYRQWLTHKLGGWHDQYGRSGCVGCGRCITWCPVGIDITEEAGALCAGTAP